MSTDDRPPSLQSCRALLSPTMMGGGLGSAGRTSTVIAKQRESQIDCARESTRHGQSLNTTLTGPLPSCDSYVARPWYTNGAAFPPASLPSRTKR